MANTPFRTFRELRDAINTMPDDLIDRIVYLNQDNGRASDHGGGVLDLDYGNPTIVADGD